MKPSNDATKPKPSHTLSAPDAKRYTIGGVVWRIVQTPTGVQREPWSNVAVQLGDSGHFDDTDDKGRYCFRNLPCGVYSLVIREQAKAPQVGDKLADGPVITVPPAPYDVVIDDSMLTTAKSLVTIAGVLWRITKTAVNSTAGVKEERLPWSHVRIELKNTDYFANTDARGWYRFTSLPPGDYQLVIYSLEQPPRMKQELAQGPTITVPTYDAEITIEIPPANNPSAPPKGKNGVKSKQNNGKITNVKLAR